jgi:hypothetical protein
LIEQLWHRLQVVEPREAQTIHAQLAERNSGDEHRATTQAAFLQALTILLIDIIGYILSQMPDDLPTVTMRSRRRFGKHGSPDFP